MDRAKLIKFLERRKACKPALAWLAKQKEIGPELLGQCPDLEWLEWLLERTDSRAWNRYLGKVRPLLDEHDAKARPILLEFLTWDAIEKAAK